MATLKDIARKAGVNVSTVSRALNGSNQINEETRRIIKNLAVEMNYIRDISAKVMAGKRSKSIGVIVPEMGSNYFAQILNSIEAELKDNGYSLIVGMTHHDYRNETHYLKIFSIRKVDGIILTGSMYKDIEKYLLNIKDNHNIPMVLMQPDIDFPDYDCIMIDDMTGFNAAVKLLADQGHKDIGFIADEVSSKMRLHVFKAALAQNGLKLNDRFIKVGKEMFEQGGYLQMREMLKQKELPTAIVAAYDYIAIGALKAMNENGLKVPDNISIVSYDNIRESAFLVPSLTTISPPIKEMAKIGVKLLIDKIENKENKVIQHISLKPELVIRDTTRKI